MDDHTEIAQLPPGSTAAPVAAASSGRLTEVNVAPAAPPAAHGELDWARAALEQSADGIEVVDRLSLRLVDVNAAAAERLGRTREEMLGTPPWSYMEGSTQASYEAFFDEVIRAFPHSLSSEQRYTLPNGTLLDAEVVHTALLIRGQWLMVVATRDVTGRKQQQIRSTLLSRAFESSHDCMLIVDRESMRHVDCNDAVCRYHGMTRNDLLQVPPWTLWSDGRAREDLEREYDDAIAVSPLPRRRIAPAARSRAGTRGVMEEQQQAIRLDGRWMLVITTREVREDAIQRQVAELTRSNEELKQFAYVTSHDLFEPLRMMSSYSELLRRRYGDQLDSDAQDFIGYIAGGADRMKRLIDDLLLYSRVERSAVPAQQVRLDHVLDDAMANLANAIERSGAVVERGPLPEVTGESSGLTQVFQNLIGNAIKFTAPGTRPRVRVHASEDEANWIVSVRDNGIGIAPESFERIFVIFQRLHAQELYEGTGIGLTICKKVVERHGGRIVVDSAPGQGTTFTVYLPKTAV
ncbi:ATP-binding protein [Variovorax guangxiensis]|uniref:sensor histidine kinase n=1 Tax=Variovorax guangxiensis TaxID=1775474 RepID=UPI002867AE4A|nr:ATP-binding protein [Variovorax guangxiensis]MDR6856351.1 PAS domain S-box-containing protein [Variovorax guangxiensis]